MSWLTILADAGLDKTRMFQEMHLRFVKPEAGISWKVPLVLGLLLVALILAMVLARMERRRVLTYHKPKPMRLYLRCLRGLQIGWWDIWHMWRLARRLQVDHPTALLISAPLYDNAVERYCQEGNPFMVAITRGRFVRLRRGLFASGNV